jgi:electron transport complex protein RnfC
MHLLPPYIYQSSTKGEVADLEYYNTLDCIQCGACTYNCPAKLPLMQGILVAKQRVMDARKKK